MTRIPDGSGDRLLAALAQRDWTLLSGLLCASLALTGGALLLPTVLGRAVDSALSGAGYGRWLTAAALLVAVSAFSEVATAQAGGTDFLQSTGGDIGYGGGSDFGSDRS